MRIVLDTNVLVSAMLKQGSPPDLVLSLVIAGRVELVVDSRIRAEYRAVLARPVFRLPAAAVDRVLRVVEASEWVVPDPLPLLTTDPDDQPFLEVAIAAGVDAIVTGNTRHFRQGRRKPAVPIMTPREFIDRLRAP
ncbi:MAG: putative toxin-antitoxin system toxin component, PIN family [Gemmatimonadales bacterium]